MSRVLLHTCCAPCFVSAVGHLKEHHVEAYFYNPFIHPFREYRKRFKAMKAVEEMGYRVRYRDEYVLRDFLKKAMDMEEKGEVRCGYCYRVRLAGTASMAVELGMDAFATTLVVSPYQNIDLVNEVGREEGKRAGIRYMEADLRHLHDEGHDKAREMGLYLQGYCGCIFSEEERYKKPLIER